MSEKQVEDVSTDPARLAVIGILEHLRDRPDQHRHMIKWALQDTADGAKVEMIETLADIVRAAYNFPTGSL